jgi:hypothetical protein
MISETGNWTEYRARFCLLPEDEIDLHHGRRDVRSMTYDDAMREVEATVRTALQKASERGREYVMFIHGWSTSRPGATTARSVVRGFMRSREATPFIERAACIQHEAVFVAKLKISSG